MAMKTAKDHAPNVLGENMQQNCEGIRVKGIELRSYAFLLSCVQKIL